MNKREIEVIDRAVESAMAQIEREERIENVTEALEEVRLSFIELAESLRKCANEITEAFNEYEEDVEVWKDILEYEGLYQISNLGRVKSFFYDKVSGRIIKEQDNSKGYKFVHLKKNKIMTNLYIHRLVGASFLNNDEGYTELNHKDNNPANNEASNLEWCSRKYNCNYGDHNKKLSESIKRGYTNGRRPWNYGLKGYKLNRG